MKQTKYYARRGLKGGLIFWAIGLVSTDLCADRVYVWCPATGQVTAAASMPAGAAFQTEGDASSR